MINCPESGTDSASHSAIPDQLEGEGSFVIQTPPLTPDSGLGWGRDTHPLINEVVEQMVQAFKAHFSRPTPTFQANLNTAGLESGIEKGHMHPHVVLKGKLPGILQPNHISIHPCF